MTAVEEPTTTITLADGIAMPSIGLGTHPLFGQQAVNAVGTAIRAGYRLLDTAYNYENEASVGRAARASDLPREELFLQTKLAGRYHQRDQAIPAVEESLLRLGVEQVDSVLIHWPNPITGHYVEAWRTLVELRDAGLIRTIGVSNFEQEHLERIIQDTGVVPSINQIELSPRFTQEPLREVHRTLGIVTQAWRPLGKGRPVHEEPVIVEIAEALGVTPAQVVLRWHRQLGIVPLPKSADPGRQASNLDTLGFSLDDQQMERISALDAPDGRTPGLDPSTHEEF